MWDLQDGDRVVTESIHLWFPGFGEGGWVTPAVVIECEEVASFIIGSAVEVVSSLDTVVIFVLSAHSHIPRVKVATN